MAYAGSPRPLSDLYVLHLQVVTVTDGEPTQVLLVL